MLARIEKPQDKLDPQSIGEGMWNVKIDEGGFIEENALFQDKNSTFSQGLHQIGK